jgi:hypothetical protein
VSATPFIPVCFSCGSRVKLDPKPGVYIDGHGYCIPCERAIRNAPNVTPTPESIAFVARLAARGAR